MFLQLITPLGIAAEPNTPNEGIVAAKTLACRDWNYLTLLYEYLDKNEKREFLIEAHKAVIGGSCSLFEPGEAVYIVDIGVSSIKLRRKNETDEYWMRREAIEPARS